MNFNYAELVDKAMRQVVRDLLRHIERTGLPDPHHFFISFRTDAPGVSMSEALKRRYPQEITIVLQHQFWDLKVEPEQFRVALSFNNIPEKLVVPFDALINFADPSAKFGLQFYTSAVAPVVPEETLAQSDAALAPMTAIENESTKSDKILMLDAFRKK